MPALQHFAPLTGHANADFSHLFRTLQCCGEVEIYEGKMVPPTKIQTGRVSAFADGEGTVARMELNYEMKGGILGKAMDSGMLRNQFSKAGRGLLAGLKHYIETGEEVTHPREIKHLEAVPV
ncbi:MAG: hypothetical protein GY720_15355 [bacterium]|nr:hypothetical protein [bacterium]